MTNTCVEVILNSFMLARLQPLDLTPMTQNPHQRICHEVAKSILVPEGFKQKGRSRFWYDDCSWYAICFEFQPFSGRRGSAVNAGITWLWNPTDFWSYDLGGRVGGFIEYKDDVKFEKKLGKLANKALNRVLKTRKSLLSPKDACALIKRERRKDIGWRNYNMGIAAGLSRQMQLADSALRSVIIKNSELDWVQDRNKAASELLGQLGSHKDFCALVESNINKHRALLKLPSISEPIFPD